MCNKSLNISAVTVKKQFSCITLFGRHYKRDREVWRDDVFPLRGIRGLGESLFSSAVNGRYWENEARFFSQTHYCWRQQAQVLPRKMPVRNKENHSHLESQTSFSKKLWHLMCLEMDRTWLNVALNSLVHLVLPLCGLIKPNIPQRSHPTFVTPYLQI